MRKHLMLGLAWLLACLGAVAGAQDGPVVENGLLRVGLDAGDGRLTALTDRVAAHEHIDPAATMPLWTAALAGGKSIGPDAAKTFSWEKRDGQGLTLMWGGFDLPEAPELRVTARVSLEPGKASSRWRIAFDGLGGLDLRAVHFPRVGGLARQPDETLAVPVWMGELTRSARDFLNPGEGPGGRRDWEYPGLLSMQCMAFYRDGGPGVEISTDDTNALRKEFAVFGDGRGGLGMEVVHIPAAQRAETGRYETPCDAIVGAFTGDWYTAAQHYRAWAQDQPWVRESRIRRGLTPAWVLDTGLWVWNRGRSPGVLGPAAALQERAGLPVSVFWHWWHGCSYDTGFPEYLPPREGEEAFRQAVAEAHDRGIHAIVYMNQRLWGMKTQSWAGEGAERYAVKAPDGAVTPEVYNTFTKAPCASMCMGTDFWREKYAGLAEAAVRGLGVDGIYMDQACSSLACYDPAHGHPIGGGSYWMQGFKRLESDIRRRCADTTAVALAGEGCGEAWLPHLDIMLSLQVSMERYAAPGVWEPIPFFHAVYHDCAVFYGNYASLTRPPYDDLWPEEFAPKATLELLDRKFATQFRLEQARSFVWGQQPTVANFQPSHLAERDVEMNFVLRLARLRAAAAKYLRDGVFLRPPDIGAPQAEIPMSRLSIYAGQHDAVKEFRKTVPLVLAGAWQAADGTVAVALANIADTAVPLHFSLERDRYPIPEQGAVRRLQPEGEAVATGYDKGRAEIGVELPPYEVAVYVIGPR